MAARLHVVAQNSRELRRNPGGQRNGFGGDMNSVSVSELSRLCNLAPHCEPEWGSITKAHHNVLLEGPRDTTEAAILLLMPYLAEPIVWRRPGEALELEAGPGRTLIVEDVGALDAAEQTTLCGWLGSARKPAQVVSTNKNALFSAVTRGLFDERLYYRLNVMLVPCRAVAALPGGLRAADGRPLQTEDTQERQHRSSSRPVRCDRR